MIVYHGSDDIVITPDLLHSSKRLDFGIGFYVTTVKEQAERWAKRKATIHEKNIGYINVYEMKLSSDHRIMDFSDDLETWIDFVCNCRNGSDEYLKYDIIKGKVADDKVFRVVDMYKRGIWNRERAIQEIRVYKTYDQIAFVSQKAIDSSLLFEDSIEVVL